MDIYQSFSRVGPIFIAIGEVHRQQILVLLCRHQELSVSQVTELVHLSRPAVSHHLKVMLDAGLLKVEQRGVERFYSLDVSESVVLLNQFVHALESTTKYRTGKI